MARRSRHMSESDEQCGGKKNLPSSVIRTTVRAEAEFFVTRVFWGAYSELARHVAYVVHVGVVQRCVAYLKDTTRNYKRVRASRRCVALRLASRPFTLAIGMPCYATRRSRDRRTAHRGAAIGIAVDRPILRSIEREVCSYRRKETCAKYIG